MIEVVPRSGDATGAGTMAGAAVGGTATGTADRVYRVTLRMDDGSTRVITQEWAPTFRSGDRVNLTGGEIQRR
jgi:outer membrane lipoprotein SlyB